MKKRITAFFMAVAMALSMVACGGAPKENPDAIIHEYTPPQFSEEYMPAEITTDQHLYDAWEYVIDKAMGDGAIFSGVPAFSMSKGYFRQETANMGYEHMELTASTLTAQADGYNIEISNYLNHEETTAVNEISLQIFNMNEDDFNPATLENANNVITLGRSQQVLGKTTDEMFEYLEISDLMLEFIKKFGSSSSSGYGSSVGTQYSYSWYEGDSARYQIIYTEGRDTFYNTDTASISFIREENGYEQNISYSNVSGGPVCSVHFREDALSEAYMQNLPKGAADWRTKESMVDIWLITEKTENGVTTAVDVDWTTYLELGWGDRGRMKVPVFADSDVEIEWRIAGEIYQENPDEKLVFRVEATSTILPWMLLEYHYADDSIVVKNQDNTLSYKFERLG